MQLRPTYGGHQASRGYPARSHARSAGTDGAHDVAPLTFDELCALIPKLPPPPSVYQYRAMIEPMLGRFTPKLIEKAERLRAKGLNIPERFFPRKQWTRDEVLSAARAIYLELLTQRYASPGDPATL